jgi:hypothetical protein
MDRGNWLFVLILAGFMVLASCKANMRDVLRDDFTPAHLVNASEVAGCRRLGQVKGVATSTKSANHNLALESAGRDLRNQAGRMGATHVVLQKTMGHRRPVMIGAAYKCEARRAD